MKSCRYCLVHLLEDLFAILSQVRIMPSLSYWGPLGDVLVILEKITAFRPPSKQIGICYIICMMVRILQLDISVLPGVNQFGKQHAFSCNFLSSSLRYIPINRLLLHEFASFGEWDATQLKAVLPVPGIGPHPESRSLCDGKVTNQIRAWLTWNTCGLCNPLWENCQDECSVSLSNDPLSPHLNRLFL